MEQPRIVASVELRPSWRGWFHVAAFVAAFPGTIYLLSRSHHPVAIVASAVYGAALLIGYGTSAGYHRLARSERATRIMQRLDHSTIFILIVGTYTPVCLLGLPRAWGIPLLSVVGVGALVGILAKQFAFSRLGWLEYALYPILGWAAIAAWPALVHSLSGLELTLIVAGGLLYTLGIPVLVVERPNPWPYTFGYHEIWHGATVAAGICHFAAVGLLLG